MGRLDDFLVHNIDGYLQYDVDTMARNDANGGGVGYPLVGTAASAIEFFGGLTSPTPFQPRGQSRAYFVSYWTKYLYPSPSPNANYADAVYQLARCGIAHSFVLKGHIGILRHNPAMHLKQSANGMFLIDAVQLARDVLDSYHNRIKPLLTDPASSTQRATMEARLSEMESAYGSEAANHSILAAAPAVPTATFVDAPSPLAAPVSSSVSGGPPSSGASGPRRGP
jgi:hypothetical protein